MEYLSLIELSEYIKKPKMWVYKNAKYLGVKNGRRWLFTKEWTDNFMNNQREIYLKTLRLNKRELPLGVLLNQITHGKRRIKALDPDQTKKKILDNPHFFSLKLIGSISEETVNHDKRISKPLSG